MFLKPKYQMKTSKPHAASFEAAAAAVRRARTAWLPARFLPRLGELGLDADVRTLLAPWLTAVGRREEDGEGGEDEEEVGERDDEVEDEGEDEE